jgi:hypothetical protein
MNGFLAHLQGGGAAGASLQAYLLVSALLFAFGLPEKRPQDLIV